MPSDRHHLARRPRWLGWAWWLPREHCAGCGWRVRSCGQVRALPAWHPQLPPAEPADVLPALTLDPVLREPWSRPQNAAKHRGLLGPPPGYRRTT